MPEYIEIHLIVAHIQSALGLVVSAIDPLGAECLFIFLLNNIQFQLKMENHILIIFLLIYDLRYPLQYMQFFNEEKKLLFLLAIVFGWSNLDKVREIFYSNLLGNYMYYLNRYSDLEKEPFKSDGYLALKGININKEGVLVLVINATF